MSYSEPKSSLCDLTLSRSNSESIAVLRSSSGVELEIEFITDCGWSIETRYDKQHAHFRRQGWSGIQNEVPREKLTASETPAAIKITAGAHNCTVQRKSGQFTLHVQDQVTFVSHSTPFSYHSEPAEVLEELCSLEVTEWTSATPFRLTPTKFETHMVRFQYPRTEKVILGLPGQAGEANRNGYRFELYNNDQIHHTPARQPLYQSWPILCQPNADGSWIGIFHDNPSRTFVDVGDFYHDLVTFESLTNNSRVYIVEGKDLAETSHKLCSILGTSIFPPLWAFGYQQCRFSYTSTENVRDTVAKLRDADIPLDVIYFDGDYMDGYRVFTRDPKAFGDLKECLDELHAQNKRAICIVDPCIKVDEEFPLYQQLKATDAYWKNKDGTPFVTKVWPGKSLLPDFHTETIQELWSNAQKQWLDTYPFDGIWNDMNEPSNFDGFNEKNSSAYTARGSHKPEFNLYGYKMARASKLGWDKYAPNTRTLLITRSGYPGVQSSSVIWHGDNSTWWEHIRLAIDTAIAYSLAGSYYTGPDIPGFFGNPSDDHAVRSFQLGTFLPFYRGHSYTLNKLKEPFAYEEKTKDRIRTAIKLRYSLLREWYSGFERSIRELRSPLMPILDDTQTLVRDSFMLFEKFLIFPITQRDERKRACYLPAGDWYRFGDPSQILAGETWLLEDVTLDTIPIFVRAGSIVVRNTPGNSTVETFKLKETYDVYPARDGHASGYWFNDDGVSIKDANAQRFQLALNKAASVVERFQQK